MIFGNSHFRIYILEQKKNTHTHLHCVFVHVALTLLFKLSFQVSKVSTESPNRWSPGSKKNEVFESGLELLRVEACINRGVGRLVSTRRMIDQAPDPLPAYTTPLTTAAP